MVKDLSAAPLPQGVHAEVKEVVDEVKRSSIQSFRNGKLSGASAKMPAGSMGTGGISVGEQVVYCDRAGVSQSAQVCAAPPYLSPIRAAHACSCDL